MSGLTGSQQANPVTPDSRIRTLSGPLTDCRRTIRVLQIFPQDAEQLFALAVQDVVLCFGVNSRKTIVENQQLWLFCQCPGNRKPLLLTS